MSYGAQTRLDEKAVMYDGENNEPLVEVPASVIRPEPSCLRSRQSDTLSELAKALAKAQGEIRGALKGQDNPHFKSKYADLAAVWEACRGPLANNGLSVIQSFEMIPPFGQVLETMLLHESGEFKTSYWEVGQGRGTGPQAIGSAATYARRYSLSAIVGVAPEDDDGEAAEGRRPEPAKKAGGKPAGKAKPANGGEEWKEMAEQAKRAILESKNIDELEEYMASATNIFAAIKGKNGRVYEFLQQKASDRKTQLQLEAEQMKSDNEVDIAAKELGA